MRVRPRLAAYAVIAAFGLASAPAYAGSPIYGYGDTRGAAASDANRKAASASSQKFGRGDCYTPVRPQDCRQDGNGWICIAYLANHRGSCGFG